MRILKKNILIQPSININFKFKANIKKVSIFEKFIKNSKYRVVRLMVKKNHLNLKKLKENTKKQIISDFQEIWHRNYTEIESGNLIDQGNYISESLDIFSKKLNYNNKNENFDKIMLRSTNDLSLNGFHTDHFNSFSNLNRKYGFIERTIINLREEKRVLAILDLEPEILRKSINSKYNVKDYLNLYKSLDNKQNNILLVEIPKIKIVGNHYLFFGIQFNSYPTLHATFGYKGDFSAVLSNWFKFDKLNQNSL